MSGKIMGAVLALLWCAFGAAQVIAQNTPSGSYQQAGFLSGYSKLRPEAGGGSAEIYIKPGVDWKKYNQVILDRIRVWYQGNAPYQGIDPTELKALTDYFHGAIVTALGDAYPVVSQPGPGVLRIRIAITDLVPTQPGLSEVVAATSFASLEDFVAGRGSGSPPYLGEAAIEAEFLDSQNNAQLAAYLEKRIGKKYDIDTKNGARGAVAPGVSSFLKSYSSWAYARSALDYWAQQLRRRLDEVHGKAPARDPP